MVMSWDQNVGQSHSMKIDNSSFERVGEFKYLRKTLTNQNSTQEEIKADWSQEIIAIIWCRILCIPVC